MSGAPKILCFVGRTLQKKTVSMAAKVLGNAASAKRKQSLQWVLVG